MELRRNLWSVLLLAIATCSLFTLICGVLLPLVLDALSPPQEPFSPRAFVEGVWVPSEYTLRFMRQSGYRFSSHSIKFLADGTVEITNMPSEWFFRPQGSSEGLYSGSAEWSIHDETAGLGDLQVELHIVSPTGEKTSLTVGTRMDYLDFDPVNKSEVMPWVTIQKCYPTLHITDGSFQPLVDALRQSPRDQLGFSPITPKDRIEVRGTIGKTDIRLSAYNDFSSHGIMLRLRDNRYVWVSEQESFSGPEKWVDHDAATWEETITLQYQTEAVDGGPINDLIIDYIGHDPRLINRSSNWYLSNNVAHVLPILEEWRQWRTNQPPSPQSLCP